MSTYQELLKKREALDEKINDEYARLRLDAILTVQGLRDAYDLTLEDVFPAEKTATPKAPGAKVPPKYRDPTTGATWTGRGKPPTWIRDRDRTPFLISIQPLGPGCMPGPRY